MAYQIIFTNDPSQRTWEKPEVNVSKKKWPLLLVIFEVVLFISYIRGYMNMHCRFFLYPIMGIHIKQQVW